LLELEAPIKVRHLPWPPVCPTRTPRVTSSRLGSSG
jgi:hypothetical protein